MIGLRGVFGAALSVAPAAFAGAVAAVAGAPGGKTGSVSPPAVAGGTLLISKSGTHAYASNPEGNSVDVINLAERKVVWNAALGDGASDADSGRLRAVVRQHDGEAWFALDRDGATARIRILLPGS